MYQSVYKYMHHSLHETLLAKTLNCWSNAFVINNVSGIAIEPKEFILSHL